jgi:hypothetical protein
MTYLKISRSCADTGTVWPAADGSTKIKIFKIYMLEIYCFLIARVEECTIDFCVNVNG